MLETAPSETKTVASPSRHRDYLDGIRALAALWVVLSHLWIIPFGRSAHDGWLGLATNWTLYSHFAVDIFIVLSGFCLILPVARDGGLKGGTWAFFRRRARRILPPFYAALAVSLVVSLLMQWLTHQRFQINGPALLANIFQMQDLFDPQNHFNGPFWSIAVEWRIYFLFPLMVWAMTRWGRSVLLVGAALVAAGVTVPLLHLHPEMLMASPWYLFLFALGVCAGSLSVTKAGDRRSERRFWLPAFLGAALALAALLHLHPVTAEGGADFGAYMPLMDVAAGTAAAASLLFLSRAARPFPLLTWRPLVTLGTFAYSLYLVHMPCLLLFNRVLTACLPALTDPLTRVLLLACSLPFIIGLAYSFFLAFERPFLSRRLTSPSLRPP